MGADPASTFISQAVGFYLFPVCKALISSGFACNNLSSKATSLQKNLFFLHPMHHTESEPSLCRSVSTIEPQHFIWGSPPSSPACSLQRGVPPSLIWVLESLAPEIRIWTWGLGGLLPLQFKIFFLVCWHLGISFLLKKNQLFYVSKL